jgi:hypothetical protein
VDRLQAQVRQRREAVAAQQRVAELEQRIGAAREAGVQLGPERAEPRQGEVGIGMAAQPDSHISHRQPDQGKYAHQVKSQAKNLCEYLGLLVIR